MKPFLLFSLVMCASAQSELRNTVTAGGGLAQSLGQGCCGESAPSVAVTYAYRLFPHVDAEAGVDMALSLGTEYRGSNFDIKADDRFIWVPFGLRGVLPVRRGRLELSVAAGGMYERYSVGNPAALIGARDGWGGYASMGAALALDRSHHFWLGASPNLFIANTSQGNDHNRLKLDALTA